MAPKLAYGLLLTSKGEVKKSKLCGLKESISLEQIQAILKKKKEPVCIGTYNYDSFTLHLFGFTTTDGGAENKHDLPPPLCDIPCYGDILLIGSPKGTSWTMPVTFTPEQYEIFYTNALGGAEEGNESDSEDSVDSELSETLAEEEEGVEAEVKKEADAKASMKPKGDEYEDEEEDSDDLEEEEEDVEEQDEEGHEDHEDAYGDDEEEEKPVVKKREPKKKPIKASISHGQNTGRAKQQHLLEANKIQPISFTLGSNRQIPDDDSTEATYRRHVLSQLEKYSLPKALSNEEIEYAIFEIAYRDAKQKQVIVHFHNPLFQIIYKSAARRVLGNCSSASYVQNNHLGSKLASGDITLDILRSMQTIDYAPHLYSDLRERQLLREQNQLEGSKAMATDLFKCGRCHKRETTFYELQTRSADEPMTKFITCLNCANHWRM